MVEVIRLIRPTDDFRSAFPGLDFQNAFSFRTTGEKVLLVDPTYLADVYNTGDAMASYLRVQGLFLMDFGGDVAAPVWWKPPFLVMPLSMHFFSEVDLNAPDDVQVLASEIGCDSGSFVFLPLSESLPIEFGNKIKQVVDQKNAVVLDLPAGMWSAYYEQFEPPQPNMVGLYRNIVLEHTRHHGE
jgi:hypothetical protein